MNRLSLPGLPFWVLGSVLAYAVTANVPWLLRAREGGDRAKSRWLLEIARFCFYLGIPYLALGGWPLQPYHGILSPEDMGLVGLGGQWPVTRWLEAVGTGLGLGLIAFLLLLVAWANARDSAPDRRLHHPLCPWWVIAVDGLYLQVHWAFYRSALGITLDDIYQGVFAALAIIYVEWSLNPFWRWGWHQEARAAGNWLRAALALVATLVFLLTRNLWVCLAVHGGLELAFWRVVRSTSLPQPAEGA